MTKSELITKLNAARIPHNDVIDGDGIAIHVHVCDQKGNTKVLKALIKAHPKYNVTDEGGLLFFFA